uniref:Response regulatory domain-containing protein n=1 Tax=Solanum lycopersicum TaxID=4081 RepID=A0A3Q7H6I0_SOLLC
MFYNNIIVWFNLVVIVNSAKDVLGVYRSSDLSFDLVITEFHMPEMNGFQLQQVIAKEFSIPIACEFIILYILLGIEIMLYN